MKAYVIRDKENNYFTNTGTWTEKICYADIYDDKNHTERLKELELLTDCEVAEITITEGDLDAYIDKLQDERDFERRDKTYIVKQLNDPNDYVIREDYIKLEQRNKQLEEQLVEKNKEIGELKHYVYSYNNEINNRPQICNEYIDAACRDILDKMKELKL